MNIELLAIQLLLSNHKNEESIGWLSELKSDYFGEPYRSVISAINNFYAKYEKVPDVLELQAAYSRNLSLCETIEHIRNEEFENDIDLFIIIDALKDQHTQEVFLANLETDLDKLPMLSSQDLVHLMRSRITELEELSDVKEYLFTPKTIRLMRTEQGQAESVIKSGISDVLDNEYGAWRREEYIMLGGKRGSGKSVLCANLARGATEAGYIVPYFSLEMTAEETFGRFMSICSGVESQKMRNQDFSAADIKKLAYHRAENFSNGAELLEQFGEVSTVESFIGFEDILERRGELVNGMIIIDDPQITLAGVDAHIARLKGKYGNKIGMVIVDYVNQVELDGHASDQFDWKTQILLSKGMKALARKHEVLMVSPYQIDDKGEARLAKGLLDSPDFAFLVHAHKLEQGRGYLEFECTKARGLPTIDFNVEIDWNTLRVDPRELTSQDLMSFMGSSAPADSGGEYEL